MNVRNAKPKKIKPVDTKTMKTKIMMNKAQAYVEGLSNEALFDEWQNQYLSWTKTGVLEDGIIRNIETKLRETDKTFTIHQAERMFKDECTMRFAMIMATVNQGIDKYRGIRETLKENYGLNPDDNYDYDTDIKNTAEFISDLKKIKKVKR